MLKSNSALKNLFFQLIVIILCAISGIANAQEVLINFENQYNKTAPNSVERYEITGKYAQALLFNNQKEKAFAVLKQNIASAEKLSDGKYAAYLHAVSAMNNRIDDNLNATNYNLQKAIYYSGRTTDYSTKGYVKYCEGWLNLRNNEEAKAVKNFIDGLKFLDKAPVTPTVLTRMSSIYNELTGIYSRWDDYELQEKYSKLALEVALKQNNPNLIFTSYMSIGYMLSLIHNEKNIFVRDLAEKYYSNAIDTYYKNKNEMATATDLSFVAINLANLYLQYYPKTYQGKVIKYAYLAKEIAEQNHQSDHVAAANGILAELSLQNNEVSTAKNYLLNSLIKVNENTVPDKNILLSLYLSLSDIEDREGNYKEALRYYKLYTSTYKEVYDNEQAQILSLIHISEPTRPY